MRAFFIKITLGFFFVPLVVLNFTAKIQCLKSRKNKDTKPSKVLIG